MRRHCPTPVSPTNRIIDTLPLGLVPGVSACTRPTHAVGGARPGLDGRGGARGRSDASGRGHRAALRPPGRRRAASAAGARIPDGFLETHPRELLAAMAAPSYIPTGVASIDRYAAAEADTASAAARRARSRSGRGRTALRGHGCRAGGEDPSTSPRSSQRQRRLEPRRRRRERLGVRTRAPASDSERTTIAKGRPVTDTKQTVTTTYSTAANPCANDADLRPAVHERLTVDGRAGVNEVCVRGRRHRLDMAGMLDGTLCGFEIKADNDDLSRLRAQARAARPRFRRLVLVVGRRRFEKAVDAGAAVVGRLAGEP